jgi:hypothetical protein
MSFDALTMAGFFSALLSGGFLIGLVRNNGADRPSRREDDEPDDRR